MISTQNLFKLATMPHMRKSTNWGQIICEKKSKGWGIYFGSIPAAESSKIF